jgi:hypothetical protein
MPHNNTAALAEVLIPQEDMDEFAHLQVWQTSKGPRALLHKGSCQGAPLLTRSASKGSLLTECSWHITSAMHRWCTLT